MSDKYRLLASRLRCRYQPFFQGDLFPEVENFRGACMGISKYWLDTKRRNVDFCMASIDKSIVMKLQRQQCLNHSPDNQVGFAPSASRYKPSGEIKGRCFLLSRGEGMNPLRFWLTNYISPRYFLISTKDHSMAFVGSRLRQCHFFDPNVGAVSGNPSNIIKFIEAFFIDREYVRSIYWGYYGNAEIEVTKYKD